MDDACPLPRPIIHRFTGTVTTKAIASEATRLPQKSRSATPASIAPGMTSRLALSTSSITAIETVSAASATPSACRNGTPAASTGRIASVYPKKKASTIEIAMLPALCQPSAVLITMPRTSPIAQPVRQ